MNQRQIDRAVASATGESLGTIRRHGFSIVRPLADAEEHRREFVAEENAAKVLASHQCRSTVGSSAA